MNRKEKRYHAKLLLFGEYTVIRGSKALAMPYPQYFGFWDRVDGEAGKTSNRILKDFALHFLGNTILRKEINFTQFALEVENGLFFNSTILQGFGIGSSGALCAAIYDRYKTTDNLKIEELKQVFASLESYFHGSSSGADPLICYLEKMLVFESTNAIQPHPIIEFEDTGGALFLINTQQPRKTGPFVNLFLEKIKSSVYKKAIEEELTPYNNTCIEAYLKADRNALIDRTRRISKFQFTHFQEMIPSPIIEIWKAGMHNENYSIKLCGAGGGGFMIGITDNFEKTKAAISHLDLEFVHHI